MITKTNKQSKQQAILNTGLPTNKIIRWCWFLLGRFFKASWFNKRRILRLWFWFLFDYKDFIPRFKFETKNTNFALTWAVRTALTNWHRGPYWTYKYQILAIITITWSHFWKCRGDQIKLSGRCGQYFNSEIQHVDTNNLNKRGGITRYLCPAIAKSPTVDSSFWFVL